MGQLTDCLNLLFGRKQLFCYTMPLQERADGKIPAPNINASNLQMAHLFFGNKTIEGTTNQHSEMPFSIFYVLHQHIVVNSSPHCWYITEVST